MLRINKPLLLALISSSTMANQSLDKAIAIADSVVDFCSTLEQSNTPEFPKNEYFESLSIDDKRDVITFLWIENTENCQRPALNSVLSEVKKLPIPAQKPFINLYTPSSGFMYIQDLDIEKIVKLRTQFNQPFNGRKTIESLGLMPTEATE
ncbi:exported hypothetical protein [Vibrio nigripulchritudo SO65]|uniref:hypothetical protein n=1 Tax=Vibrio nigripulchritudo TaxID=28173 RepID=UPI0003B1965C|nr:hypothetical protein [Vibrio nigripulchritudo]CCN34638.1 exported hypothetical protein [Vibrio nigripulchritudo AM115]CCN40550.1 exported hypothetical protein [Vibrio nigripulchritudo FTn2]CCN66156.1 exported hypothetical protein [Vibrio nigripulchritudo POn4]CCN78646.1 exported hypothetical protein [Vibrio nigripulchritudo SO65]